MFRTAEVEDIRVEVVERIIENEEIYLKDLLPKGYYFHLVE